MLRIVSQYLRQSAYLNSKHVAFIDNKFFLTYENVLLEAEKIAAQLIDRGLFKKPVAVLMERCSRAVVSFFSVAMSGNYYTVIDEEMPQCRVNKILSIFEPSVIITDKKNKTNAEALGYPFLVYEEIVADNISFERKSKVTEIESKIIDTDILYVLFTSGSTGVPKGVLISHRSVIDYTEWVGEAFALNHDIVIGNQVPFYFDMSVFDIYSSVRNGGTLHIIPKMLYSFPIRLLEYIRDNQINTIFWVPTALMRVVDFNLLGKCDISCLKKVLFAGEVMPARILNAWIRALPNTLFANMYGPTEITVICTCFIVNRIIKNYESVPIGYACMNTDIMVLNRNDELVGVNEKGELCVRGSSLALGYYKNPEDTAIAFVQNPLNKLYHELIYRTGDIVHYNERGELIYDGRKDSQIKHSGHRIELGEIETVVSVIPNVNTCCCIHDSVKDQLVLFYVGEIRGEEIRKYLALHLPHYMIPNFYHRLTQMPLNMNGKIDRVKLIEQL